MSPGDEPTHRLRSVLLAGLMIGWLFAGTVALSGAAVADPGPEDVEIDGVVGEEPIEIPSDGAADAIALTNPADETIDPVGVTATVDGAVVLNDTVTVEPDTDTIVELDASESGADLDAGEYDVTFTVPDDSQTVDVVVNPTGDVATIAEIASEQPVEIPSNEVGDIDVVFENPTDSESTVEVSGTIDGEGEVLADTVAVPADGDTVSVALDASEAGADLTEGDYTLLLAVDGENGDSESVEVTITDATSDDEQDQVTQIVRFEPYDGGEIGAQDARPSIEDLQEHADETKEPFRQQFGGGVGADSAAPVTIKREFWLANAAVVE
ncbi:MAG: surface glycoprotein, partial [Natronomonas sp.]